jgi:DNA-binding transcriptional MocR family regulator
MRLSEYTDYTLRVLMYCAAHRDRLVTIGELAEQHGLSKNHLMKVVNDLARQGLLETTRGAAAACDCWPSPRPSASAMWCAPPKPTSGWWSVSTPAPTPARCRRAAG